MDFSTLLRGEMPTFSGNATETGGNFSSREFHDGVLKSLMPLFGGRFNPLMQAFMLFYNMAGSRLGFDPSIILTALGFVWAANKLWRQVYMTVYGLLQEYLTASVHISSSDEMYLHLMKWLASQPNLFNSRSLTAETTSKTAWEEEDESDVAATVISADGSGVYLNFSNQEAKMPPRFVPALGAHSFWFNGRYFRLHRKQESLYDDGASGNFPQFKEKEKLIISCYGRSPEPIKRLLSHTKELYYRDHHAKTIVRRPSPQNLRKYGGRHSWTLVANRPVRPMKTVVLDAEQKVQVLSDINEYLHPATPRWYANRGIPLRRGYLFHGPPGTGKTSLSFALAGVFGLDIYVISLLEPSLTEEDLSGLFSSLPRRCVVLLEDIDTAGLSRSADDAEPKKAKEKDGEGGKEHDSGEWKVSDLARELKRQPSDHEKKGISLSGLLNAIDGVASHEGRVLIMTTNKPEELDEALIRPGRVDLQVAFTYATQSQAKELFERMYEGDKQHTRPRRSDLRDFVERQHQSQKLGNLSERIHTANGSTHSAIGMKDNKEPAAQSKSCHRDLKGSLSTTGEQQTIETTAEIPNGKVLEITLDELSKLAAVFASKIPNGQFSPAEIQGFLLKRKKNPRKALEEVGKWVEAMLQQKASKTKVMQVQ